MLDSTHMFDAQSTATQGYACMLSSRAYLALDDAKQVYPACPSFRHVNASRRTQSNQRLPLSRARPRSMHDRGSR
jgi:hypothetical protein